VPAVGEQVTLHTHLIVRDDALALYGFHSEQERDLFLMLLSVQAVGPKVALAVLSAGAPRELIRRWRRGTRRAFRRSRASASAPPSGSSSSCARRWAWTASRGAGADADRGAARGAAGPAPLARDGLLELGYAPLEAEELLRDAEGESAEELIAHALRLARAS
jgi:Holliday junction DNA helicase RuvA